MVVPSTVYGLWGCCGRFWASLGHPLEGSGPLVRGASRLGGVYSHLENGKSFHRRYTPPYGYPLRLSLFGLYLLPPRIHTHHRIRLNIAALRTGSILRTNAVVWRLRVTE